MQSTGTSSPVSLSSTSSSFGTRAISTKISPCSGDQGRHPDVVGAIPKPLDHGVEQLWIGESSVEEDQGKIIFSRLEDRQTIQQGYGLRKSRGSMFNPLNFPTFFRNMRAGSDILTTSVCPVVKPDSPGKPLILLDGADEVAQLLVGSGMPKHFEALIKSLLIFPPFMPPTQQGYDAAEQGVVDAYQSWNELKEPLSALSYIDQVLRHLQKQETCIKSIEMMPEKPSKSDLSRVGELLRKGLSFKSSKESAQKLQGMSLEAAIGELEERVDRSGLAEETQHVLNEIIAELKLSKEGDVRLSEKSQRCLKQHLACLKQKSGNELETMISFVGAAGGTGAMWWAIALFEGGAIAELFDRSTLVALCNGGANGFLLVGQAMMMGFGLVESIAGIKSDAKHREFQKVIEKCRDFMSSDLKKSIDAELRKIRELNLVRRPVAGATLFAGQGCMLANTIATIASGGTFLAALIVGVVGTLNGIGLRIGAELWGDMKFGYDPSVLSASDIEQQKLEELKESVHDLESLSPEQLQTALTKKVISHYEDTWSHASRSLALMKIMKTIYRSRKELRNGPVLGQLSVLTRKAYFSGKKVNPYQHKLRSELTLLLESPELSQFWQELVDRRDEPLSLLFAILRTQEVMGSSSQISLSNLSSILLSECREFTALSEADKVETLTRHLKEGEAHPDLYQSVVEAMGQRALVKNNNPRDWAQQQSYFDQSIEVRKKRYLKVPMLSVLAERVLGRPIRLWDKRLKVYMFKESKFKEDLRAVSDLADSEQLSLKEKMLEDFLEGVSKALFDDLKYHVRSKKIASEAQTINTLLRNETIMGLLRA